jgi:hypothetical protein
MAIVQISKIQVRSGNLVDLPQLDDAEFGWASDQNRLFIGKSLPNENIEVLTSYSNVDFSQINGAVGNLNIANTAVTGQILAYNKASNIWVNAGGNGLDPGNTSYYSSAEVHLGNVSTLKIGGGSIGYVLETDGTGNLTWTPKSTIIAYLFDVTSADPAVVTTTEDNFFTMGAEITITDVEGMTELNGNTYFVKVLTSNTFELYTDDGLTVPVDSTLYGVYLSGGRAISVLSGGGGGGVGASGSTYSVQYNSGGVITGDANITWNFTTKVFTVTGDTSASNISASGNISGSRLLSNVATGTSPLVVSSTTRVANLNVSHANLADFSNVTTSNTGIYYPTLVSGNTTSGYALSSNANIYANLATGTFSATNLNAIANASVAGTLTLSGGAANSVVYLNGSKVASSSSSLTFDGSNLATTGTIVGANVYANSGTVGGTSAVILGRTLTTGANTTTGTITGTWTLSTGSSMQATYADLAEYYEADTPYEPGTVLAFGGDKEVTVAEDGTTRVAGVVSTNPAYAMNQCCKGFAVPIALQGRVPTKVRGTIRKGDMMVSAGNGFARPWNNPAMGTVIGKALEDFDGIEGIIEVAVGRL